MMKILVTGNTPQQCGRGTQMKYGPVIDLFVRALRDAGAEVDHRIVGPDTKLTDYDALWLGMSPINSMSSRYMFGPLDLYRQAFESGFPTLFWVDDWQTHLLNAAFKSISKEPKRLVREPGAALQDSRHLIDWAREPANLANIAKGVDYLYHEPWPTTVAPFYTWGNHLSIFEKHPQITPDNLVTADPSRYVDWYPVKPAADEDRTRQWVCGILSNQTQWLDDLGLRLDPPTEHELEALETGDAAAIAEQRWPLWHVGGKASKADMRMKEADLVQKYAESWGVLSPPYWHVGSGWWRNRFVYSAYAGSVIAGDPREGAPCGSAFMYPVEMIEQFSTSQLRALADAQRQQLGASMMSKEELQVLLTETFRQEIASKR
jgi:hypothetical protein